MSELRLHEGELNIMELLWSNKTLAAKDMANLRGRDIGDPYTPNLPTPEGPVLDKIRTEMRRAGLI